MECWVLFKSESEVFVREGQGRLVFERTTPPLKRDPINHEQWVSRILAAAATLDRLHSGPHMKSVLGCISCHDSRPVNLGAQTYVCLPCPQITETHRLLELAVTLEIISCELLPLIHKSRKAHPAWRAYSGAYGGQAPIFGTVGARKLVKVSLLWC